MRNLLAFFGRKNELSAAEKELCARLTHRATWDFWILPQGGLNDPQLNKAAEAKTLLTRLKPTDGLILWDETGEELNSQQLATKWQQLQNTSPRLVQVIGGAFGVDEVVKTRAQATWSLGRLTWSRALARRMVLEQLYRAQDISAGGNFAK